MTKSWIKIHLSFDFYYLGLRLFPKTPMDNTLISLQNWVIKDAGRLSFLFVERNCADIKRDIWVGCCTFLVLCELKKLREIWLSIIMMHNGTGDLSDRIQIFIDVQFHEKIYYSKVPKSDFHLLSKSIFNVNNHLNISK